MICDWLVPGLGDGAFGPAHTYGNIPDETQKHQGSPARSGIVLMSTHHHHRSTLEITIIQQETLSAADLLLHTRSLRVHVRNFVNPVTGTIQPIVVR